LKILSSRAVHKNIQSDHLTEDRRQRVREFVISEKKCKPIEKGLAGPQKVFRFSDSHYYNRGLCDPCTGPLRFGTYCMALLIETEVLYLIPVV
jgi:hypothetical protein